MEQTIQEKDILDFLDKLQLFVVDLGNLEYFSSNEQFQYFIKTDNYSFIISLEELIANRNKKLSQETFNQIADKLKNKTESKNAKIEENRTTANNQTTEKPSNSKSIYYTVLIIALICIIGYIIYNNINTSQTNQSYDDYSIENEFETNEPKTEEELREELRLKESANANDYLSGSLNYSPIYKNLLSIKVVGLKLEGKIKNSATIATYKNAKIKVTFLSNTGEMITTKRFTVYEYIPANSKVSFTQEVEITNQEYNDIQDFKWDIVNVEYD